MSTELDTRTDHVTGLSTIEGIDLDATVACEDPNEGHQMSHPADLLVRMRCESCGTTPSRAICHESWVEYGRWGVNHAKCGTGGERDDLMWIVHHLR